MGFSVLEWSLVTERHNRRMNPKYQTSAISPSSDDGFVVPGMMERKMDASDAPFLVTNARSSFLPTRQTRDGNVRYGFSNIPSGQDDQLLPELFRSLWSLSEQNGWTNRCASLQAGLDTMSGFGLEPRAIIIPYGLVKSVVPSENFDRDAIEKAMEVKGRLTSIGDVAVRVSDSMPDGCALVLTGAPLVGFYTRIGDYVGLLLRGVNHSIVMVRDDMAG